MSRTKTREIPVPGRVSMRVFRAAVLAGLMAIPAAMSVSMPASAQNMMPGFRLNESKEVTPEEAARIKAIEDAAKAARATIPNAKVSSDPWATVRTEPAAKPAKKKATPQ